jgi:hypothetical protein
VQIETRWVNVLKLKIVFCECDKKIYVYIFSSNKFCEECRQNRDVCKYLGKRDRNLLSELLEYQKCYKSDSFLLYLEANPEF